MAKPRPLTQSEEYGLAIRIATGDVDARNELAASCWWLVRREASRFRGDLYREAYQDGCLALLGAATRYRPGDDPFPIAAKRAIWRAVRRGNRRRARAGRHVSLGSLPELSGGPRQQPGPDVESAMAMLTEEEREAVRDWSERGRDRDGPSRQLRLSGAAKLRRILSGEGEG